MHALANPVEQLVGPFVDGEIEPSASEAMIDVVDPSTGRVRLAIPTGCDADVLHAVQSARRAFDDGRWCDAPPSLRKRMLHRFADLVAEHAAELDALDAGEMGKPISEKRTNAADAAQLVRFFAEAIDKIAGDVFASDKNSFVTHRRVPRGVVAAIVPWNFPTFVAVLKLAPALAAGNCVILKPSELATRSSIRLAQLATQAGLPEGVLNVVPGTGEIVGRALGLSMDVDMLTFTGSTEVGKLMFQYAGQSNMKVVMAECGGKSPHIVFDDGVDLQDIGRSIARFLLCNQGQICSVGSRVLVQKSIERPLIEAIVDNFKGIVVGNALEHNTTFGPLASAKQCARVMQYIDGAKADGVQLVTGGRRALPDSGGYFVEPTVFGRVPASARIAREEIFGPVLSVIPFDAETEAVRIANDTIYGLTAYAWTADLSRAMRVAKSVRSSVRVNAVAPLGEGAGSAHSNEPARQTGLGVEGGLPGMESYLRRQLIAISHG